MKFALLALALGIALAAYEPDHELIDFDVISDTCGICDFHIQYRHGDGDSIFQNENLIGLTCFEIDPDNSRPVEDAQGIIGLLKKNEDGSVRQFVGLYNLAQSDAYDYWTNEFYAFYDTAPDGTEKAIEPWLFWENYDLVYDDEAYAPFDETPNVVLTDYEVNIYFKAVAGVPDTWVDNDEDTMFECWGYHGNSRIDHTKLGGEGWNRLDRFNIPFHQCLSTTEVQDYSDFLTQGFLDNMAPVSAS